MRGDIVERLRVDPGQITLGQLIQDREAALCEIMRLRVQLNAEEAKRAVRVTKSSKMAAADDSVARPPFRAGAMIRISDICEFLGISRSTIYKRLSEGSFPPPVHLGPNSVRWRIEAIEAWRDSHADNQSKEKY